MVASYQKGIEKVLIGLLILFIILSLINPQFTPLVFITPALIFIIRMIQDIKIKNDKQASKNLTTTIIFVIAVAISIRLINL